MEVKVGYLVAYDYELIRHSLPTVYDAASKIVLAIDKDRKTFAGQPYHIDEGFFEWLREVDKDQKLTLYEDQFYLPGLTVEELDTRKRNMLGKFMGEGGWHFQVDADEYFVDFGQLVENVRQLDSRFRNKRVTVRAYWQTIFKAVPGGYLLVDGGRENFALATNHPVYETMRYNHSNKNVTLNHVALHQSFGRSEGDLERKFQNWSHANDFDTEAYLNFWKSVNLHNYRYVHDFNAVYRGSWMRLKYVQADSIQDLLRKMSAHLDLPKRTSIYKLKKWIPPVLFHRLASGPEP